MNYYELYEGRTQCTGIAAPEWNDSYDVIVAGGGNAGIYGAIASAREGKRVLLIEKSSWCGGIHVQGLVNGYYYGCRGGLYEEIDKEAGEIAQEAFYDLTDAKRLAVKRQLERNGVEVKVTSVIIGLYTEGQKVVGVRACYGHTVLDIKCRMVLDATSDGHILRLLPVKTRRGRECDHEVQPFSSVRCVYLDQNEYDGGLRVTAGRISERYGLYHEYRDNGYVNQYDDREFSEAVVRAHASHLKTLDPAARFLYIAPLAGVREGILFEGEQTVTLEQVLGNREKPKNILLYGFSDVDKHGSDLAFDEDTYQDWFVNCNMSTCTVYIPVPVGAVVPKGWKGIIVGGRCLSMDSYVNSAIRMNSDTFRVGEACGVLASMATDQDQDAMKVSYESLKEKLTTAGFFNGEENMEPSFWTPARGDDRKYVKWLTEPEQIKEALSTDCPGVALWSCRLLGKEVLGDSVYEMMKSGEESGDESGDKMLKYNAAVALGVMKDERALPVLREIVENRKPFYFMDCRRSNQMRSVIAICLCGRMGDKGVKEELLEIIKPEEFEKPMYHQFLEPCYQLSIVKEQNSVYFQHFSHAVAALVKIAEVNPECREEIKAALHEAMDDGTYIRRITQEPEWNAYYQAAENCRRFFLNRLEENK
ncbi:FAD-dependent oxidoreductase [Hungatella hathewayi]|uniref:FAD-dependent oxidoreductase n=1 Tax=Hungatella hathewayi TaxID=154046 RepID=UPI00356B405D